MTASETATFRSMIWEAAQRSHMGPYCHGRYAALLVLAKRLGIMLPGERWRL